MKLIKIVIIQILCNIKMMIKWITKAKKIVKKVIIIVVIAVAKIMNLMIKMKKRKKKCYVNQSLIKLKKLIVIKRTEFGIISANGWNYNFK